MYFRSDDDVRECDDVRTELMPFIQSQYAASVRITALLQSAKDHILPDADIALFYDTIFNVETAQGYGLDVFVGILLSELLYIRIDLCFCQVAACYCNCHVDLLIS